MKDDHKHHTVLLKTAEDVIQELEMQVISAERMIAQESEQD